MILKNNSIDCVIFGFINDKLCVLLWQTESEEAKRFFMQQDSYENLKEILEENPIHIADSGYWGVIGAHIPMDRDLDEYAKFMLTHITGLNDIYLKQVKTFGKVDRVPFLRVLTTAYYAIINPEYHDLRQSEMAKVLRWVEVDKLPEMMLFDHREIIDTALQKLREMVQTHPIGFKLLPEKFTLTQLQTMYEVILNTQLDTRNFRKKVQKMGLLIDTNEKQTNVAHRAAKLYKFNMPVYEDLKKEGAIIRFINII